VSSECATEHGAKHNSLSIFRTFDKSPLHLGQIERTQEAIVEWMEKSALPTLIDFANEYVEPVFKRNYASLVLYTDDINANYSKVFEEAAAALQGEILFVRTGNVQGIQKRLVQFSEVKDDMLPTIRILQPGKDMKRYFYTRSTVEEISVASLKAFIDDFKAGRLQRDLKSQEEPSDQVEVYTIVGKTWHRVV